MWIKLIYLIFVFCCIIFDSTSLQNEASLSSKWRNANSINTFQQNTKKYPFLIQNIKIEKIINLIDQGVCQFNLGDLGRYLILDNEVYLYGGKKGQQKNQQYYKYLQKVLKVQKLPDVYLIIQSSENQYHKIQKKQQQVPDRCRFLPMFTFIKSLPNDATNTKFLLPNINILIDQWQSKIEQIQNLSLSYPWKEKIPKLFYRGTCNISFENQQKNITSQKKIKQKVLRQCQRCGYVVMSNQHPDMVDAKLTTKCVSNQQLINFFVKLYGQAKVYGNYLQLPQQNKYRYLLYADAEPISWNQAALFLFSNSIIFIPYSQKIQWFYQYLIPNKNFILINNNIQDILKKMKQLQKDQIKAMQIVKNANTLAEKHLTSEGIVNFTTALIKKYAKVQKLALKQNQKNDIKKGIDAQLILKLKFMKQKWENLSQLVIFQKILCKFSQLQQNLEITKLLQKSNNCNLHLARFIILDNQLYCQGKYCLNQIVKNLQKLIKRALSQYIIPDLYFLIRIDQKDLDENISQSCRNLPYFIFNKDPQFQDQKNKFLFPHPDTQQFKDQIKKFVRKINNTDWVQKQSKMFFGGTLHYNEDLSSLSLFAKSLINLINQKKEYFQARIQNSFQRKKQVAQNVNQKYKYTFISQGVNTKDRKSHILAMMSKSIVLSHKIKKLSWLDQFLIPGKHYIQINENLSNLKYTIQLLIENDEKAKQICDESFILALLKFQDNVIQNYIAQVLKNYSKIQKLKIIPIQKQEFLKGRAFIQVIMTGQQKLMMTFIVLLYYAYLKIRKLQISSVSEDKPEDKSITSQQIYKEALQS